jgi:hypothetical protein
MLARRSSGEREVAMANYVGKIRVSGDEPFEVVTRDLTNPPHDLVHCFGIAVDTEAGELVQYFEVDVPDVELSRYELDPGADQRVWSALAQAARLGIHDVLAELGQLDDDIRPKRGVAIHVPSDVRQAATLLRDVEQLPMPSDLTIVFEL